MPSLRNDRARHINLNKIIWLSFARLPPRDVWCIEIATRKPGKPLAITETRCVSSP